MLLDGATAVIEQAVDVAEADIDPMPRILRFVAVEVAVRGMANPSGLASRSEALGAASQTERFRDDGGLWLTDSECRLVREAVLGQLSGTAIQESIIDDCVVSVLAPASYPGGRPEGIDE